jgi:hypothetical protein
MHAKYSGVFLPAQMRFSLGVFLATALMAGLGVQAKAQSMMDSIIYNKCAAAMAADFQKAGKTPAAGMIPKTCNCVVKTMNQSNNIDLAKQICTQQAMQAQ